MLDISNSIVSSLAVYVAFEILFLISGNPHIQPFEMSLLPLDFSLFQLSKCWVVFDEHLGILLGDNI